jgi:hypothetical protein
LNTWRGDQWTSCQSISTVLLTLCTLLCSDPLLNEPGVTKSHNDMKNYNEIIEFSNLNIAVCCIVSKKNSIFLPFFENFYPFVKENFNKNYEKLIEITKNKINNFGSESKVLTTGFYSMKVEINYEYLLDKLNETKQISELL